MADSFFIDCLPEIQMPKDSDLSLYHMTHVDNVESILKVAQMPRRKREKPANGRIPFS